MKSFKKNIIEFGIERPKTVIMICVMLTLVSLFALPSIKTDTDPVHMLNQNNPAITLYSQIKDEFNTRDMIVVGVMSHDGSSVFTPERLARIHAVTREILTVEDERSDPDHWFSKLVNILSVHPEDDAKNLRLFVKEDVFSLSTVDDIILNASGELLLKPLMDTPPENQQEADQLLAALNNNPLFMNKLAAADGTIAGIYIPLEKGKKDRSYFLSKKIEDIANKHFTDDDRFFISGLPVAENTFGNEMFIQMAVYAPGAGLVIFILLYFFFRNLALIAAPMILALLTVTWSMAALIFSGQSIHIMSSMIPIFLMPIAVLDSVHILSTLHDQMNRYSDRKDALRHVMDELFLPMLFTSVTTVVGFASLATTGIPPVVVFGVTIAFGVALAWILSMVFIPAYSMLLSEKTIMGFGRIEDDKKSVVMEVVHMFKGIANQAPHVVIVAALVTMVISIFGIRQIIINDNPVRWFKEDHVIRKADRIMNKKLAGTYWANLYFSFPEVKSEKAEPAVSNDSDPFGNDKGMETDEFADFSMEANAFADSLEKPSGPSIRNPEVIQYIDQAANFLRNLKNEEGDSLIGGITTIADVLRKVGMVAFNDSSLPDTREKVSQYMFLFESGDPKKGSDMWKLINPGDSLHAQAWIQFKTGDNQNMQFVIDQFADYMKTHPVPVYEGANGEKITMEIQWAGLTYINKVWQDEMVTGMAMSLIGSFVIVFVMMVFLFRSFKWGVVAMLPLSLTITMIYGAIGFAGKFYDIPIAVLSSLTLGLSVDFAIHFIQHARQTNEKLNNAEQTFQEMFEGTAQAIWRNVLVISIGFSPLFFAPLVPYVTVGAFFFGIMLVSGITTLILLPAILKLFSPMLPSFEN
ncbi:MAG: MMPL family transporter [SAR324 cluster bacterium]|nr:MMPL family transporter [SAR324 cluster bacterium]